MCARFMYVCMCLSSLFVSVVICIVFFLCVGIFVCGSMLRVCTVRPQVLLGEVTSGLNSTQVVVKELKTSASIQDQMHFLEEAQPYR